MKRLLSTPSALRSIWRGGLLVFGILLVAGAVFAYRYSAGLPPTMAMNSLNCTQLSPNAMARALLEVRDEPLYKPAVDAATQPVHLQIHLPGLSTQATRGLLLTLFARSTNSLVYRGPYQPSITIAADAALLRNGGGDSPRFGFYSEAEGRVCVAEQQFGAMIWVPHAQVHIDFLPEREIDPKLGLPVAYRVRVERQP